MKLLPGDGDFEAFIVFLPAHGPDKIDILRSVAIVIGRAQEIPEPAGRANHHLVRIRAVQR